MPKANKGGDMTVLVKKVTGMRSGNVSQERDFNVEAPYIPAFSVCTTLRGQ